MLRVRIVAVGRGNVDWVEEACAHYEKILQKYAQVETDLVSSKKLPSSLSSGETRAREMELLAKHMKDWFTVALTDGGSKLDSLAFSRQLDSWRNEHGGKIQFLIGGPFGLDPILLLNAGFRLSLSPLTLSHQLVRPVLMEQIYRGLSILAGADYHK